MSKENLGAQSDIEVNYYFESTTNNRKQLFNKAIVNAQHGKVLYIVQEEFTELPQLSQELASVNRHYMKMLSFLYVPNLSSLLESISTLPDWQHIPHTVILDNLSDYCPKDKAQNACGLVALLVDTVKRCSSILNAPCKLLISMDKESVGEDIYILLKELFCVL